MPETSGAFAPPTEVTQEHAPQPPTHPTSEHASTPAAAEQPRRESGMMTWGRRFLGLDHGTPAHMPTPDTTPLSAESGVATHPTAVHAEAAPVDTPASSTEASTQPDTAASARTERMIEVNGHEYPEVVQYRVHNADYRRDDPVNTDFRRYDLEKIIRDIKQREVDAAAGIQTEPTQWDKQDEQTLAYCLDAGLLEKNSEGALQIVEAKTPSTVGLPRREYFSAPDPKDVYSGPGAARFLNTTAFGWIEMKARTGDQGNPADAKAAVGVGADATAETGEVRRQYGRLAAHVIEEDRREKSWSGERVVFDEHTNNLVDTDGKPLPFGSKTTPIFEVRPHEVAIYTGEEEPVTYPNEQLQKDVIGVPLSNYTELLVTLPNGETGALVIGTKRNIPLPEVRPRTWLSSPGSSSEADDKKVSRVDGGSPADEPSGEVASEARVDVLPPLDPPISQRVDAVKNSPGWKKVWQKAKRTILITILANTVGGAAAIPDNHDSSTGTEGTPIVRPVGERPMPPITGVAVPMPENHSEPDELPASSQGGEQAKPAGGVAVPMPEIGGPRDLGKTPSPAEDAATAIEPPVKTEAKPIRRELMEGHSIKGDVKYEVLKVMFPEVAQAEKERGQRLADDDPLIRDHEKAVTDNPLFEQTVQAVYAAIPNRSEITRGDNDGDKLAEGETGYDLTAPIDQIYRDQVIKQQEQAKVS